MFKWFRTSTLDPLIVSMAGVKLGNRVLVAGCGDPRFIAAVASKSGLTGRACAIDDSDARVREAERVTLAEGALVEASVAPLDAFPFEPSSFDLVVLRDLLSTRDSPTHPAIISEASRVLRPGGRCMVIDTLPRSFFSGQTAVASRAEAAVALLKAHGFAAVRTLAEREGTVFVEAFKPGS